MDQTSSEKVYVVIGQFNNQGSYEDYTHYDATLAVCATLEKAKEFANKYDPIESGYIRGKTYENYKIIRESPSEEPYNNDALFEMIAKIDGPNIDDYLDICEMCLYVMEFEVMK